MVAKNQIHAGLTVLVAMSCVQLLSRGVGQAAVAVTHEGHAECAR